MLLEKNKKSQAALEFLTTYAWAFLVIIITIAALAYFGVLSPSKLLPDRCNFGPEIGCMQYIVKENGLQLKLKNNAGTTIRVNKMSILNKKSELNCISSIDDSVWKDGSIEDVAIYCDGFSSAGIIKDNKEKFNLEVSYYPAKSGTTFTKTVNGEVFGIITSGSVFFLPKNGLVGYWKFDEGLGSTVFDSSGSGNDGSLTNFDFTTSSGWVDGKFGKALQFDGSNDFLRIEDSATLRMTNAYTIIIWANYNGVGAIPPWGNVLVKVGPPDDNYGLWIHQDRYIHHCATMDTGRGCFNSDIGIVPIDSWIMLTGVFDGSKFYTYLDDKKVAETDKWGSSLTGNGPVCVSTHSGDCSPTWAVFKGKKDEVKIYNRALSDLEIKAMAGVIS